MDAVLLPLLETIVTILLDPTVLGGTIVLMLVLGSGLAARVFEAIEVRLPRHDPAPARRATSSPRSV